MLDFYRKLVYPRWRRRVLDKLFSLSEMKLIHAARAVLLFHERTFLLSIQACSSAPTKRPAPDGLRDLAQVLVFSDWTNQELPTRCSTSTPKPTAEAVDDDGRKRLDILHRAARWLTA